MKPYQPDFIKPSIFDSNKISSWFTKKGESVQDNFKIEGLNFGFNTNEDHEVVQGNRSFLANAISTPIANIAFANQVHGNEILEVKKGGIYDGVDGFITKEKELALAIQVADCAAVLLADTNAEIISAVHAGWRGAEARIVPKAVQKMIKLGATAKDIKVFVSPCISEDKFELGEEVASKFPDEFINRKDFPKPHLNIKKYIKNQLLNMGVIEPNIEIESSCTFSEIDYYSYRRDGVKCGRMMGIIKLNNKV